MQAQLIPVPGGETITLAKDLTLVGRREDCDLRLEHKSVSKMHCVLVKSDGLILLRDLGSTNGTRVNGQRVRRAALLANDEVMIAHFKFRVHLGPEVGPIRADEHTQNLDAAEVAKLLRRHDAPAADDSSDEIPAFGVQSNALPDVYPEEQGSGAAGHGTGVGK
jgi:predicted component of type VI protein secretion system